MQHGHKYESMETVKAELSPRVMEMMIFEEAKGSKEIFPFLTTSEGLGTRSLVARLASKMNGELFVEDVPYESSASSSNNEEKEKKQNPARKGRGGTASAAKKTEEKEIEKKVFRRLIFGSNSNLIQSEAKVTLFDDLPSTPSTTPVSSFYFPPSADPQASEDGQKKKKKKKNKKKKATTTTGDQVTTPQESPANTPTPTPTLATSTPISTPSTALKQAVKPQQQQQQKVAQKKYEVDYGYLACQHHRTIVAGLSLLYPFFPSNPSSKEELGVVVVGLGGGSLPMFLHRFIAQSMVEVVELDPVVGEVAKKFFGFNEGARMKLHIDDGLEYIKKTARQHRTLSSSTAATSSASSSSSSSSATKQKQIKKKNVVILDADSKDLSTGMSCPPSEFIEEEFLGKDLKGILSPEGMLVVNLVCRSSTMKQKVLGNLKKHFQEVHEIQVSEEELNTIVFAFPTIRKNPRALSKLDLVENMGYITELMETSDAVGWQRNAFNLEECLKGINLPETTSAKKGGGKGKKRK
jgi:hypothetical protein